LTRQDLRIVFEGTLGTVRARLAEFDLPDERLGVDGDGFPHLDVYVDAETLPAAVEAAVAPLIAAGFRVKTVVIFDERFGDDDLLTITPSEP
jgi:hypothetical protein